MFAFQNIANKYAAIFSLEILWLKPFWAKPELDSYDEQHIREAMGDAFGVGLGRMIIGVLVTFLFGLIAGIIFSLIGIPSTVLTVPILGFLLFLWGKLMEHDEYSTFIAFLCLSVGILWGLGALLGNSLI